MYLVVALLTSILISNWAYAVNKVILFNTNAPLNLDISGDFQEVLKDKLQVNDNKKRRLHDVSIVYKDEAQKLSGTHFGTIQVRGWNRVKTCDFPPLKLKVDSASDYNFNDVFSGTKNLKIVTRCNETVTLRWVPRELAIYKLYEAIEPLSLRTRLTNITYRQREATDLDNLTGDIVTNQDSFLIESGATLAKRSKLVELELLRLKAQYVSKSSLAKINLFNFMIGNYDAEITLRDVRNVKLLQMPTPEKTIFAVPYDFDYSDWVRKLKIRAFNKKHGFCSDYEDVIQQIPSFIQNKDKMIAVINEQFYLDKIEKRTLTDVVNNFINFISDDTNVRELTSSKFREKCRMY